MPSDRPPLSPPIAVEVSDTQGHLAVDAVALAALARRTLVREGVDHASISIALVDDPSIRAINRRHLDHDWPTDVITFPLSDADDGLLAGELVVSAQMAAETARGAGGDPRAELTLYVIHGLLHLCGFNDLDPEGAALMRRAEAVHLAAEGLVGHFATEDARWAS